jgi:two-component sensor histidine kinase
MTGSDPFNPDAALSLALVNASNTPLLLLDGSLLVIAASASFCKAFEIAPKDVDSVSLSELGSGEWGGRQLQSLLQATASGSAEVDAYEMDLVREGRGPRHLILNARKLNYADRDNIRIVLAIADVTDARASERIRENLLHEKAILLKEVQHRVANSLQIIASVLMQSARKVQSEEARGHLQNAHSRVMSIAAVQQQLAASTLGDVQLRPYLVQLCQSLGASMIHDHTRLSIEVKVDDSVVDANVSVSLGLMVTELVINALKHAYIDDTRGRIVVGYHTDGEDWTLSVTDDGVGMPTDPELAKPGLGTGIVEALAKQLQAEVQVSDQRPGTKVSIVYLDIVAVAA